MSIAVVLVALWLIGTCSNALKDDEKTGYAHSSYSYGSSSSYGGSSAGTSTTRAKDSKYCIVSGCYREKSVEGGQYCFKHKCHVEGCTNKRVDGDWSCVEHGGVVGYFNK